MSALPIRKFRVTATETPQRPGPALRHANVERCAWRTTESTLDGTSIKSVSAKARQLFESASSLTIEPVI